MIKMGNFQVNKPLTNKLYGKELNIIHQIDLYLDVRSPGKLKGR